MSRRVQLVHQIEDHEIRSREFWDYLYRKLLATWAIETGELTPQVVRFQQSTLRNRIVMESVLPSLDLADEHRARSAQAAWHASGGQYGSPS